MEARARQLHERGQHTRLFELMRKANRNRLTSGVWERALTEDDRLAHELIDEAYDAIAAASASVVNLLDIDGIVLGGGLGTASARTRPNESAPRCALTSSTRRVTRLSDPQNSATTAARSAPPCSLGRSTRPVVPILPGVDLSGTQPEEAERGNRRHPRIPDRGR